MGLSEEKNDVILLVGSKESVFVTRTAEALRTYGYGVRVADTPVASISCITASLGSIIRFMMALLGGEPRETAIVCSLPVHIFWVVPLLRIKHQRVVGIAFGSDILRRKKKQDVLLELGLSRLDMVVATNENVLQAMLDDFPAMTKKEHGVVRFGLPVFEGIDSLLCRKVDAVSARISLGFSPEKKLISVGYCASQGQRQVDLVNFFDSEMQSFREYEFVVPIQYGSSDVKNEVLTLCKSLNEKYGKERFHVLVDFHEIEKAAMMRCATSILINHSLSDSFSGTVQEVVYAGGLVLAADHLPYKKMPGYGSAIRMYKDLESVAAVFRSGEISEWMDTARKNVDHNRVRLRSVSSWEAVLPKWEKMLSGGKE